MTYYYFVERRVTCLECWRSHVRAPTGPDRTHVDMQLFHWARHFIHLAYVLAINLGCVIRQFLWKVNFDIIWLTNLTCVQQSINSWRKQDFFGLLRLCSPTSGMHCNHYGKRMLYYSLWRVQYTTLRWHGVQVLSVGLKLYSYKRIPTWKQHWMSMSEILSVLTIK